MARERAIDSVPSVAPPVDSANLYFLLIHTTLFTPCPHPVDSADLYFLLVANPDGYAYTMASQDQRLWRKNRRPSPNSSSCFGTGAAPDSRRLAPPALRAAHAGLSRTAVADSRAHASTRRTSSSDDVRASIYTWTHASLPTGLTPPFTPGLTPPLADLSGNFDSAWGSVGTSDDPCSDLFHGTGPASELETKAIQDFVLGFGRSDRLKQYLMVTFQGSI